MKRMILFGLVLIMFAVSVTAGLFGGSKEPLTKTTIVKVSMDKGSEHALQLYTTNEEDGDIVRDLLDELRTSNNEIPLEDARKLEYFRRKAVSSDRSGNIVIKPTSGEYEGKQLLFGQDLNTLREWNSGFAGSLMKHVIGGSAQRFYGNTKIISKYSELPYVPKEKYSTTTEINGETYEVHVYEGGVTEYVNGDKVYRIQKLDDGTIDVSEIAPDGEYSVDEDLENQLKEDYQENGEPYAFYLDGLYNNDVVYGGYRGFYCRLIS